MRGLLMVLLVLVECLSGCTAQELTQRQIVAAADVVNEVARKGDQVYAVSVDTCHRAELAAAGLPDLERAEKLVSQIRQRCDVAFLALERLRQAVEHVDALVAQLEAGAATVKQATDAALAARDAYLQAEQANRALAAYLEGLGVTP